MSNQHVSLHIKWHRSSLKWSLLFSLSVYAHVNFFLHKLFCRAMQITLNNRQVFRGEMIKQSASSTLSESYHYSLKKKPAFQFVGGNVSKSSESHDFRRGLPKLIHSVINHLHNQTFYWINIWQYYHESKKTALLWHLAEKKRDVLWFEGKKKSNFVGLLIQKVWNYKFTEVQSQPIVPDYEMCNVHFS